MAHLLSTRLRGGVWHSTHPGRFISIMRGGLSPEPALPDSERWKTANGPEFYHFVRVLGGVSHYDFSNFDPEKYAETHPLSSWETFVPHRADWGSAVWISIGWKALEDQFIPADELVRRWEDGGYHKHTLMPRIECASIGIVPVSLFQSAFLVWSNGAEVRDVQLNPFNEGEFQVQLGRLRQSNRKHLK